MKHSILKTVSVTMTLIAFLLLGTSSATYAGSLDGKWINKDKNTRGLTKVIIGANATTFHAFGKCHPKDCDWKKAPMKKAGSGYVVKYDQGFAKRQLSVAKVGNELCVIMSTKYTDSRKPTRVTHYFIQKKTKVCGFQGMVANKANYNDKIVKAVIKFKSENGRVNKVIKSGANGRYKVNLPAGRYKVTAKATGYTPYSTGKGFFVVNCKGLQTGNIFMKKVVRRPRPTVKEDCISFNPTTAKVAVIKGRYKIVDGSHWIFDFGKNKAEAYKSLKVIKHYKMNSTCYVGRPNASLTYLMVNKKAPQGKFSGEDCTSFNPKNVTVKAKNGKFFLVDGGHSLKAFPNKKEAEAAKSIIQKYGFTKSCFIGRPDPSFTYLRK